MDITCEFRRILTLGRKEQATYRGNCTVWHNLETGERCGTLLEGALSNIWWARTHGNQKGSTEVVNIGLWL